MFKMISASAALIFALCFGSGVMAQQLSSEELLKEIENSPDAERTRVGVSRGAGIYTGDQTSTPQNGAKNPQNTDTSDSRKIVIPSTRNPINLPILFDFDSAYLKAESKPQLVELCTALQNTAPDESFMIIGHSDSSGAASYNALLSMLRAEEVIRWLVQDCGVASTRLVAVGLGESDPLPGHSPSAAVQRRVEVLLSS